ncbi:YjbH domain-containing protein [Aquabacterium sp.]|uniref:YjbH domain-containing protein n=1 Tax=Aquabacterium sp. TaxID=1872578 RepID=UPI002CDA54F9|nr:YjbH domain-containing protein [Aquabacterium sp.]HSW07407.1 YjbH domain-containing protein [Aquabacterium sp.]
MLLVGLLAAWQARADGLNAQGSWGGLAIPSARSIGEGNFALAASNAREPQFGEHPRPRSYVLGFGLWPGVDLVGRFAEYATRAPGFVGGNAADGISDLSLNAKYSFALGAQGPRFALGLQDLGGGGRRFRTAYVVGTHALGPLDFSLGYGASRAESFVPGRRAALDGVFGGVQYRLASDPKLGDWTAMAEYDGRQGVAGVRWTSPPLATIGDMRLQAALSRSGGGAGHAPGATAWTFGVVLPIGDSERRLAETSPPAPAPLATVPVQALASPAAAMSRLKDSLVALGFERVRVGRLPDGAWVVSYQNRRFAHNEVDALGIVLGLAARAAPESITQLVVQALKADQPVLTVRADAAAWRGFVEGGAVAAVRATTGFQRGDGLAGMAIDWVQDEPSAGAWAQLQLSPEINYMLGTEQAAFDYSLALRVLASVPLWRGAHLVAAVQQRVASSDNVDRGEIGVVADLRQDNGLQTLALHQSLWLGPHALIGAAVGRFEHRAFGVESQAVVFVPGRDDVLRLRGRQLERRNDMPRGADEALALSYRWVPMASTWLELGAQRYNDGSQGPSLVFSRWFGDIGAHLFYRRGGERRFAGVEFSVPLTPRAAPVQGRIQFSGSPSYTRGIRTRLLDDSTSRNLVEPRHVRDLQLSWDLEVQALNAGRIGPDYLASQFSRMRQAFRLYADSP